MPQYIFDIEDVYPANIQNDQLNTKIAEVRTEVIDRYNGTLLYNVLIPVTFHAYGVYPEISSISKVIEKNYVKREVFFRVRRYIKKLRPFL
ncbi:hypothetical protein [Alteribacillus sp. HJP-4]|uniref:hypothetical protein n=1 Tax=Alteribacillus sp. HJP-4 TaxID=2775394 RepID=UPI0035CD21E3